MNQATHMNLLSGPAGEFVVAILADPMHPTTDRGDGHKQPKTTQPVQRARKQRAEPGRLAVRANSIVGNLVTVFVRTQLLPTG